MSTVLDNNASTDSAKQWATMHYLLHIVGGIFSLGLITVVAVILNYVKRGDADGTFVRSHMDYMISRWWRMIIWTAVLAVVMSVLTVLTLGLGAFLWFVVGIPFVIFIIRMILGLMKLSERRPIAI
jgi:uncharacterized membrane protein